jgi:hypothetical protein
MGASPCRFRHFAAFPQKYPPSGHFLWIYWCRKLNRKIERGALIEPWMGTNGAVEAVQLLPRWERSSKARKQRVNSRAWYSGPMRCQFGPPWLLHGDVAPRVANFKQIWMLGFNSVLLGKNYVELYAPWVEVRRWDDELLMMRQWSDGECLWRSS